MSDKHGGNRILRDLLPHNRSVAEADFNELKKLMSAPEDELAEMIALRTFRRHSSGRKVDVKKRKTSKS